MTGIGDSQKNTSFVAAFKFLIGLFKTSHEIVEGFSSLVQIIRWSPSSAERFRNWHCNVGFLFPDFLEASSPAVTMYKRLNDDAPAILELTTPQRPLETADVIPRRHNRDTSVFYFGSECNISKRHATSEIWQKKEHPPTSETFW
jgi:hypothetical protein